MGFTFNNRHTDEFGISVSSERIIMPQSKSTFNECSMRDGSIDFSESNPYNRRLFNDRIWKLTLSVHEKTIKLLSLKLSQISYWLIGKGSIIFDDMCVAWRGHFIESISTQPKIYGTTAVMTAYFRSEPFAYMLYDTQHIITDTDRIPECANIPSDGFSDYFNFRLSSGTNTIDIKNIGTAWVRPVIELKSSAYMTKAVIEYNSDTLTISGMTALSLTIDCDKRTITSGTSNLISKAEGNFFELQTETLPLNITLNTAADMKIIYTPRFIYDADIQW